MGEAAEPSFSLPWSLRPPTVASVLRADVAVASQDSATTVASTMIGVYRVAPNFGPFLRLGWVHNAPDHASSGTSIGNPVFGVMFSPEVAPGLRLPLFAAASMAIGSAGGGTTTTADYTAAGSAGYARSAMDNMIFAVNYVTIAAGAGLAYASHGFSVQGEVTLYELGRNRGEAYEVDDNRTNLTSGLHLGYSFLPELTLSAELRYQRWLSTPDAVVKVASRRDQMTVGGGLRTRIAAGYVVLRPGIAYFNPADDPMASAGYRIVVVDVPVVF